VTIDSSTDNRIEGSSAPLEHHDRVVYDLGQAVSDTEWTLDFDFNVSAISTHRAFMPCSLSSVPMLNSANNLTTPLYDNSMGIQFNDNSGTRYFQSKVIKTGATLDETGTQTLSLNTTYYARCQRTSATEMKIQLFANASHRTAGTPTSHSTTITESDHAGVTDLRYIVVGCAGLGNNPETTSFWVDNIKLVATAKNDEFDLPENTLFEETDTYKTYWLQSNAWTINDPTRGVACMGDDGGNSEVYDFVTIATLGNATDFGNCTSPARFDPAACADATRGVCFGGGISASQNIIEYITVATEGNATDFGDVTVARGEAVPTASNRTRGIWAGGWNGSANVSTIDYVTIDTLGDASAFGDLSSTRRAHAGSGNSGTRGIFAGGYVSSFVNTIDYVTIDAIPTVTATTFGTLSSGRGQLTGLSNTTRR
jgi:hypothetical protein